MRDVVICNQQTNTKRKNEKEKNKRLKEAQRVISRVSLDLLNAPKTLWFSSRLSGCHLSVTTESTKRQNIPDVNFCRAII
jgi:hypothetical protein